MKCINCNKEFSSTRATAKYCSAKCRKLAFQKLSVLSVPENKKLSVPELTNDNLKEGDNAICIKCGRKQIDIKENFTDGVGSKHEANLLDICYTCRNKSE